MFPEEPVKANAPREGRTEVIVDPKNITKMSGEVHTDSLKLAGQLMELETNVNYCKAAKIEWLEVSPELLKHFNKGKIPDVGYSIYKDIKICLVDTAEEIARREKMDCHQILFPQEGYMKVRY